MDIRCFGENEIAEILELDPDDPRRRHLEACPKCRALALVFTEFIQDRSAPPGSDPQDAHARLLAAFEAARTTGPAPGGQPESRRAPRAKAPWARAFSWTPATAQRPALAAAAVVLLVCAVYVSIGPRLGGGGPDVLRGTQTPSQPGMEPRGWLLPIEMDAAGHPVLRWRRVPGADAYQVRFFRADLTDLARTGPLADTLLVLGPGVLPSAPVPGVTAGWQVVALQGGCELAVSAPGTVQFR